MLENTSRYDRLLEQWQRFQQGLEVDTSVIRPVILASWQRCREAGVPSEDFQPSRFLPAFAADPDEHKELLEVAVPLMEKFITSIKKGKCVISLYDATGAFLYKTGHPDDLKKVEHQRPGTSHAELSGGTSIVSLVLEERKSSEIYGPEHWVKAVHHRHGTGVPLFLDGKMQGILCCSQDISDYSSLTLAMVEMTAHMIVDQFNLKSSMKEKEILLKLVDEGLLYVDVSGKIHYGNAQFMEILKLDSLKDVYLPASLMEKLAPQGIFKRISLQEFRFDIRGAHVSCIVSCFPFEEKGAILSLRRPKQMSVYVAQQAGYVARYTFDSIIGQSPELRASLKLAHSAAESGITTLLYGESGPGKELFAQAIHNASVRSRQPFVAVNCGAIPRSLLQSELFGYVEGSFTGAARKGHPGKFELADGGTIFLDEISELPFEAQTALLRLIQTREVERIGASQLRRVNVRIIAATNKDLGAEVLRGGFRHDLLYRINALTITIPPLRQRRGDIPLLVESFLRKKAVGGLSRRFSVAAMKRLYEWKWPGNVRELENVIECAAAICGEEEISLEQLDFILNRGSINDDMPDPVSPEEKSTGEERTLSELERASLEEVLAETEGNVKKTSEILGVSRKTVYNKIHKYQIRTSEYRKRS